MISNKITPCELLLPNEDIDILAAGIPPRKKTNKDPFKLYFMMIYLTQRFINIFIIHFIKLL